MNCEVFTDNAPARRTWQLRPKNVDCDALKLKRVVSPTLSRFVSLVLIGPKRQPKPIWRTAMAVSDFLESFPKV
jgi:hypothetical protein